MPTVLANDELLNVPLANLAPGELRRAFFVQAQQAEKKQSEERAAMADAFSARNAERQEESSRETSRREAQLLAFLQLREEQIAEARQELDKRTLRLDDGRRVYVDGNKYRDEKGHELNDADRAQAEVHHLDQPHAATWQEKHDLDEQSEATRQMRHQVEDLQAGKAGANEAAQLAQLEKRYQVQTGTQLPKSPQAADYGDLDYMTALTGPSAAAGKKTGPAF